MMTFDSPSWNYGIQPSDEQQMKNPKSLVRKHLFIQAFLPPVDETLLFKSNFPEKNLYTQTIKYKSPNGVRMKLSAGTEKCLNKCS